MKDFLFSPEQARTPVSVLSGGERGRLTLARAFARLSILLVLDEPTNDLDLETLDLLQERLSEYPGTVLLVSHDRDFLDRVVTSIIAAEGDGRWIEYAGGYTDMLAQRGPGSAEPIPVATRLRPAQPAKPQPVARPRRMTFKDRHALETLPERIAALQREVARLNAELADLDLYARDPARFDEITKALGTTAERAGRGGRAMAHAGAAARGDRGLATFRRKNPRLVRAGSSSHQGPMPACFVSTRLSPPTWLRPCGWGSFWTHFGVCSEKQQPC